jgi:uncharacterized protein YndB with AHSA1/START domain
VRSSPFANRTGTAYFNVNKALRAKGHNGMDAIAFEDSITTWVDREQAWRYLTEPERFAEWFPDKLRFDRLAVGEPIRLLSAGSEIATGSIATVEPPAKFAFHWIVPENFPAETLVTFVLEVVPEGTRITVTESGYEALPEALLQRRIDDIRFS